MDEREVSSARRDEFPSTAFFIRIVDCSQLSRTRVALTAVPLFAPRHRKPADEWALFTGRVSAPSPERCRSAIGLFADVFGLCEDPISATENRFTTGLAWPGGAGRFGARRGAQPASPPAHTRLGPPRLYLAWERERRQI